MSEYAPIVLDIGSGCTKVGFAGEDKPRSIFPTVVGRPRQENPTQALDSKEYYLGEECLSPTLSSKIFMNFPVERGMITSWSWEDIEKIWEYAIEKKLSISKKQIRDEKIMLIEYPGNSKERRVKTAQTILETIQVGSINFTDHATCSYVTAVEFCGGDEGKVGDDALIIGVGDGVSYAASILDKKFVTDSLSKLELGGKDVSEYLSKLLGEKKSFASFANDPKTIKSVKERCCEVASNYSENMEVKESIQFELPDGQIGLLGRERFSAPEILFQPTLIGMKTKPGIHTIIREVIEKSSAESERKRLLSNIILTGGSTLYRGLQQRIKNELSIFGYDVSDVHFHNAGEKHEHAAWHGGSNLCSQPQPKEFWVTKAEYEEYGPSIIHQRFP